MKPEEFYQRLQEVHGITLSDEQKKQFDQYFHLLVEWNEKMNLTAITDEEGVYLKHFYDSLALGFHHELTDQTLCDVGAGAGFPSIPLKIVFPNLKVTIVDSLNKRITFLNTLGGDAWIKTCNVSMTALKLLGKTRSSVHRLMW